MTDTVPGKGICLDGWEFCLGIGALENWQGTAYCLYGFLFVFSGKLPRSRMFHQKNPKTQPQIQLEINPKRLLYEQTP